MSADEPFLEAVFAGAAFAVEPFAGELFAGADSESLSAFVDVFADDDPAVVPDLGFRRRDDCIDAAGSVRAARGAFASSVPWLASSASPPEKNTSTGRSLSAASGIKAPSPRPKPRFLRSATIYSSLCDFFGSFPIGQSATGMGVV